MMQTCPVCHVKREVFVDGVCNFCYDEGKELPQAKPEAPAVVLTDYRADNLPQDVQAQPYTPPMPSAPSDEASKTIARRVLCRRDLLFFIQHFRPKYMAGWVHADICRRLKRFLKAVELGESPRMLLLLPPRTGKSEIGSRHFPAWVLGHHPDWEVIAASHTGGLTMTFSRYIRDLLRTPEYQLIFKDTRLDPQSQSVENWNLLAGGGYMAAGVGTGITGRGCFIGATLIQSEIGNIQIEHLVQLYKDGKAPRVLSYNHVEARSEYRHVLAAYQETTEELVEITLGNGEVVTCTPNHTVYVEGRGYLAAEVLGGGEIVYIAQDLPDMRGSQEPGLESMPGLLHAHKAGGGVAYVRELRRDIRAVEVRGGQGDQEWLHGPLLFSGVQRSASCREERSALRCLRDSDAGETREQVLLESLSSCCGPCESGGFLPRMQRAVRAAKFKARSLFARLRVLGARDGDAGREKPELQKRRHLPRDVLQDAWAHPEAGQGSVCGVRQQGGAAGASHRRGENGGSAGESRNLVQGLPLRAPQVGRGAVAVVKRVRTGPVSVYDLQVEGHSNYFAGTVLVHNCHVLLLDDVVKDLEAANSPTIRENTWEWYISTAYTRLAPGGGVLGILTHWHEDDWAGRIKEAMGAGEGDRFEIVKYPAINDEGDEYLLPDDSIVQLPATAPPPEGAVLTRPRGTAIHPDRYTTEMMLRIKGNMLASGQKRVWDSLYQQNPVPDDGIFFSKDMIKRYTHRPPALVIYQAWDFAITEKTISDYTVCATIGQDDRDNLFVLDIARFRSDSGNEIVEMIIDQSVNWRASLLGFEDGQIWKSLKSQFEKRCTERKHYPSYENLVPLTDKMVRAQPLRGRMQIGKVLFPHDSPWSAQAERELLMFPAGKHDDVVDAIAWCVRLTLTKTAPRSRAAKLVKSWRDRLLHLGGTDAGHMAA